MRGKERDRLWQGRILPGGHYENVLGRPPAAIPISPGWRKRNEWAEMHRGKEDTELEDMKYCIYSVKSS